MGILRTLDKEVASRIAAGEVIERPASVVKELVENSLDANAKHISVEVREGGKSLIRVEDDGDGIDDEDLLLIANRHTTSKITDADDLFDIHSFGFRGEALYSIAAVSEVVIKSRIPSSIAGTRLWILGNEKEITRCACPKGTIIEVKSLFYNTPVRKKYLRTMDTELKEIADIMTRFALCFPEVSFRLLNDGDLMLNSPASSNPLSTISNIYGNTIAKQMIEVDYTDGDIKVNGYVGSPSVSKPNRDFQSIFINNRYVSSKIVADAIAEAYHTLMMVKRHPVAIIHIEIRPSEVDVNVHPAKREVKLRDDDYVHDAVLKAITKALFETELIKEVKADNTKQDVLVAKREIGKKGDREEQKVSIIPIVKEFFGQLKNGTLEEEDSPDGSINGNNIEGRNTDGEIALGIPNLDNGKGIEGALGGEGLLDKHERPRIEPIYSRVSQDQKMLRDADDVVKRGPKIPQLRVIGQLLRTYIVAEGDGCIYLIDQHAAQERVNFERFMHQMKEDKLEIQSLLSPLVIELEPKAMSAVMLNRGLFSRMGISIEEFGIGAVKVSTFPAIFPNQDRQFIVDLIEEITDAKNKIDDEKERLLTIRACKASVKANEPLTMFQMADIIEDLSMAEQPFSCPHGRPTIVRLTSYELEKMFKRK